MLLGKLSVIRLAERLRFGSLYWRRQVVELQRSLLKSGQIHRWQLCRRFYRQRPLFEQALADIAPLCRGVNTRECNSLRKVVEVVRGSCNECPGNEVCCINTCALASEILGNARPSGSPAVEQVLSPIPHSGMHDAGVPNP